MLCTGCGTQPTVVGRFCSRCDHRARNGLIERRRPVGGSQWQALWGIRYAEVPVERRRRQRLQRGAALAVIVIAVVLAV
jgi:hypothetical protein